jgi:hypothetical protein
MMKRLGAVVLLLTIAYGGCGDNAPRQHYEKAGGFSYDPPETWQVVEYPSLKYRISIGPRENEFVPNINVVDEAFSGQLVDYVDGNLENMKRVFVRLDILKREDFQTEDGQAAVRVITEMEHYGRRLRQTFYFFGKGKRKYTSTCSALAEEGEALDGIFEKSMKTFRIH